MQHRIESRDRTRPDLKRRQMQRVSYAQTALAVEDISEFTGRSCNPPSTVNETDATLVHYVDPSADSSGAFEARLRTR